MPIKKASVLLLIFITITVFLWVSKPVGLTVDPSVELIYSNGNRKPLSHFFDKPVVMIFWSTTCEICRREIARFNELHKKLSHQIYLFGASMYHDRPDDVIAIQKNWPIQYPVLLDPDKKLSAAFGNIKQTPALFVIESGGKIKYHHKGKTDFKALTKLLQQLIG